MKQYFRLIFSVIVGLVLMTLLTEGTEFLIIKLVSGLSVQELTQDQTRYFNVRNTPTVLIMKVIYSFAAGLLSGWLTSVIAGSFARFSILILISIQTIALLWAAFLSKWATTLPTWFWLSLPLVFGFGLYLGHYFRGSRR